MEFPTLNKRDFPTALYRLYDSAGSLLYVGISASPIARMKQHAREKAWWTRVDATRITLKWYSDRAAAEDAERNAIESERPVFNVDGSHPDALYVRLAATGQHERLALVKELDGSARQLADRLRERDEARKNLIACLVDAVGAGMTFAEAARRSGYTPEHTATLYASAMRAKPAAE